MVDADELRELVDNPNETLEVEHKSWLDLTDAKHRADLARHICALANYGGGCIVFGIEDDGTILPLKPISFRIDHDLVASITKRYLEPSLQCDVRMVISTAGREHPVVIVPPHGATPICAKADGPQDKGKPVGIQAGIHYLRKTGPESDPIKTAAEWGPLIRRCALHERSAILAAVTLALSPAQSHKSTDRNRFVDWIKAADVAYLKEIKNITTPVDLTKNRIVFSYEIEHSSDTNVTNLMEVVGNINREVEREVSTGWSMFHPFHDRIQQPIWIVDEKSGMDQDDFLQAKVLLGTQSVGLDLWRLSPKGFATNIREYWEDTFPKPNGPARYLDPILLVQNVGELVIHAAAFASRFDSPVRTHFECSWLGLDGRTLWSRGMRIGLGSRSAVSTNITSRGTWGIGELRSQLPAIVADLAAKPLRAFNIDFVTPAWVEDRIPSWRHQ